MTDDELILALQDLRALLIAVTVGEQHIPVIETRYHTMFLKVEGELRKRDIPNPIPFKTPWDWYGRWTKGDLLTVDSRNHFLNQMFDPLEQLVRPSL